MFESLVASTAPRQSRASQLLTAVVVHAGIIVCAIMATQTLSPASPVISPDTSMVFVPTAPPAAPPAVPRTHRAPVLPDAPALTPPPIELHQPTLPALSASPTLPADWVRALTTGEQDLGETAVPDSSGFSGPGPFRAYETDEPPVPLKFAAPRYPAALAGAGITGRVVAQFVVDTAGRVELASIVIVESPHEEFAASVRQALERAVFRPGRFRGAPVRVLVRQGIVFRWEDGRAAGRSAR